MKRNLEKNTKTTSRSFSACPSHIFSIPALSFEVELDTRNNDQTWFILGEWSHGYETDKNRLQKTVMRQSVLIQKDAFSKIFDQLDSIGNALHSMGKAEGNLVSSGDQRQYRYEPFHEFKFRGIEESAEPLVFVRESRPAKYLFLNPDVVIQQGLVEKAGGSGIWWDPRTSMEVIRHLLTDDGIESIQIHHTYLKRYLQARQMALLIGHYCHRHLYQPNRQELSIFEEGEVILGSPREHAKALLQNWGLRKDIGEDFLQRRLHLWFEVLPPSIDLDDPWADEPTFNPHTFTFPTRKGPVAPARWKPFRGRTDFKRFKGKTCEFMDRIYFRQEVLGRYETSSDFNVSDDGCVRCGDHWSLSRSTSRLGNDLLGTAIGDWAEGVPFSEWPHWQMHAVESPSNEVIEALRSEIPIPDLINELFQSLSNLNSAFDDFASALGRKGLGQLWNASLDSLPARQMKWVYPANANEDEFLKRSTLASTFVTDELIPKVMREALMLINSALLLGKDNKPLGSRNLLQRLVFTASIIENFHPRINEIESLIRQAESPLFQIFEKDIRTELSSILESVRSDFAPIAFLYDLRVHGGIAHPPNKKEASAAAIKLGLRDSLWSRDDFIKIVMMVISSLQKLSSRLTDAAIVMQQNPDLLIPNLEIPHVPT